MICLNNTDTLEGGASVNNVVDYTVHGLVSGAFANLAQGQLSSTNPSVLYTAATDVSVVSVIFVNTHSSVVTVDLYLDPANAGTPRRMIPKALSLGVGYSLIWDGSFFRVYDTSGREALGAGTHGTTHKAGGADDLLSAPGAIGGTTPGVGNFSSVVLTTDLAITHGGTGQSTAQAAINALSAVAGAINEHVLTKDTATGNAIFKVTPLVLTSGTWTPVLSRLITPSAHTYIYQTGNYIKIGRLVYIDFYIQISATGTAGAGDNLVSGIPYTPYVGTSVGYCVGIVGANGVFSATATRAFTVVEDNIRFFIPGPAFSLVGENYVDGDRALGGSMVYQTAG